MEKIPKYNVGDLVKVPVFTCPDAPAQYRKACDCCLLGLPTVKEMIIGTINTCYTRKDVGPDVYYYNVLFKNMPEDLPLFYGNRTGDSYHEDSIQIERL